MLNYDCLGNFVDARHKKTVYRVLTHAKETKKKEREREEAKLQFWREFRPVFRVLYWNTWCPILPLTVDRVSLILDMLLELSSLFVCAFCGFHSCCFVGGGGGGGGE